MNTYMTINFVKKLFFAKKYNQVDKMNKFHDKCWHVASDVVLR